MNLCEHACETWGLRGVANPNVRFLTKAVIQAADESTGTEFSDSYKHSVYLTAKRNKIFKKNTI